MAREMTPEEVLALMDRLEDLRAWLEERGLFLEEGQR
jgi:hypothetical protein